MIHRTKASILSVLPFLFAWAVEAQNAGINTTNPHSSAALHVAESGNKGLLIPALNTANMLEDGLIFYNKSTGYLSYANGATIIDITPVPQGTIIMWSGAVGSLPDGWVLCNGASYNLDGTAGGNIQTPDLRGRFIIGYAADHSEYNVLGVGSNRGKKFHILSTNQMPSHGHSITSDHSHTISFSGGEHSHSYGPIDDIVRSTRGGFEGSGASTYQGYSYRESTIRAANAVAIGVGVSPAYSSISIGNTGGGIGYQNRPAFYTLAFIMKL